MRPRGCFTCDTLNLVGIVTPGERVPPQLGNRIVFRDGVPVASLERGILVDRSNADASTMAAVVDLLYGPWHPSKPRKSRPSDVADDSIRQPWPLPDQAVLDAVPAEHFNLN